MHDNTFTHAYTHTHTSAETREQTLYAYTYIRTYIIHTLYIHMQTRPTRRFQGLVLCAKVKGYSLQHSHGILIAHYRYPTSAVR